MTTERADASSATSTRTLLVKAKRRLADREVDLIRANAELSMITDPGRRDMQRRRLDLERLDLAERRKELDKTIRHHNKTAPATDRI